MDNRMNWPADEVRAQRREGRLKESLKIMLAFADEALVVAVLVYFIYKVAF